MINYLNPILSGSYTNNSYSPFSSSSLYSPSSSSLLGSSLSGYGSLSSLWSGGSASLYGGSNGIFSSFISQILNLIQMTQMFKTMFPPQTKLKSEIGGQGNAMGYSVTGKNGTPINFTHEGKINHTYNVFSGDNLNVDAKYGWGYDNNKTAFKTIKNATITAGNNIIELNTKNSDKTQYEVKVNGTKLCKGKSLTLSDGTKVSVDRTGNLTIKSKEGDSKIDFTTESGKLQIKPLGKFTNLGGIIGTAMTEKAALTEDACEEFDINERLLQQPYYSNYNNLFSYR